VERITGWRTLHLTCQTLTCRDWLASTAPGLPAASRCSSSHVDNGVSTHRADRPTNPTPEKVMVLILRPRPHQHQADSNKKTGDVALRVMTAVRQFPSDSTITNRERSRCPSNSEPLNVYDRCINMSWA